MGRGSSIVGVFPALLGALLCLGGCTLTSSKTVVWDADGNVVSKKEESQKCVVNFCGDSSNIQMRDGSGLNLKAGVPGGSSGALPFVVLQAGGFTELSSPIAADACTRSGVTTDSQGNIMAANREVCVGQLSRD